MDTLGLFASNVKEWSGSVGTPLWPPARCMQVAAACTLRKTRSIDVAVTQRTILMSAFLRVGLFYHCPAGFDAQHDASVLSINEPNSFLPTMLCPVAEAWHLGGFHTAARYSRLRLTQMTGLLAGLPESIFCQGVYPHQWGMSICRAVTSHRLFDAQGTAIV